ncbi:hypothetical protein KUTeg_008461 [Tegillarca granosa]|uniref:EF-hand domain-containing protein n=1 Tax=Tegillarca granosa TaxID=220873 RepID=A0ABQ9FCA6_TEGGR|nr:hypothetical protein KUTeg_008461 [Tegillarca granosa]
MLVNSEAMAIDVINLDENRDVDDASCAVMPTLEPQSTPSSFWDLFYNSVSTALDDTPNVIIVGDINIDLLNVTSSKLHDRFAMFDMHNVISKPTRVTKSTSSLLDPVFVTKNLYISESDDIPVPIWVSDHTATSVYVSLHNGIPSAFKRTVWQYNKADFVKFNRLIKNTDWDKIITNKPVDQACDEFTDSFLSLAKLCIPRREVTIRPNDKVWFNSKLRTEIRKRDRLHRQARRTGRQNDLERYKKTKESLKLVAFLMTFLLLTQKVSGKSFIPKPFKIDKVHDIFRINNTKSNIVAKLRRTTMHIEKKHYLDRNDVIDRKELKAALQDGEFSEKYRYLLFGDVTDEEAFNVLDIGGNGKIQYHELMNFVENSGVKIRQRFLGYHRKVINGLFSFLDTLQTSVLTNVKRVFVGLFNVDISRIESKLLTFNLDVFSFKCAKAGTPLTPSYSTMWLRMKIELYSNEELNKD